jgi:GDPmannose 4,6-dehydratase
MLQQDRPESYVIATNESHSVRELVKRAFEVVNLDWTQYTKVDERFFRPLDVNYLRGDYTKAKQKLGWEPKVRFDELVEIMVKEDLSHWQRWLKGERFPWDAPNYPSESRILSETLDGKREDLMAWKERATRPRRGLENQNPGSVAQERIDRHHSSS